MSRKLVWGAFGVLVLEALAVVFGLGHETSDTAVYRELAHNFAQGHYGRFVGGEFFAEGIRAPLYPLFLLVVGWLPTVMVSALQVATVLAACGLLSKSAPSRALFFLLIAATPAVLGYASALMTEGLSMALTALFLWAVVQPWASSVRGALIVGVVIGLGVLARPNLAVLPAVPMVLWALELRTRAFKPLLAMLGALLITLSPMIAFNVTHSGHATPFPWPGAGGPSIYLSTWDQLATPEDLEAFNSARATPHADEIGLTDEVRRLDAEFGLPPLAAPWPLESHHPTKWRGVDQRLRDEAKVRISREPSLYVRHLCWAFWRLWVGSAPGGRALIPAIAFGVWLLGLFGCALAFRKDAMVAHRAAALVVLLVAFTQPVFHVEARYTAHARLPLALCATWAVWWVWQRVATARGASAT